MPRLEALNQPRGLVPIESRENPREALFVSRDRSRVREDPNVGTGERAGQREIERGSRCALALGCRPLTINCRGVHRSPSAV